MNHLKVVLSGLLAGASMVAVVPAFASSVHDAQPQCEGEKGDKGDKGDKGTSKPAPAPKPPAAR